MEQDSLLENDLFFLYKERKVFVSDEQLSVTQADTSYVNSGMITMAKFRKWRLERSSGLPGVTQSDCDSIRKQMKSSQEQTAASLTRPFPLPESRA